MKGIQTGPLTLRKKRAIEGMVFLIPWTIGFILFVARPFGQSLYISFCRVSVAGFRTTWIGLKNYSRAFVVDISFVPRLLETIRDVLIETPIILVFSLSVAILLNKIRIGQRSFRMLFFLPVVISSGYVMIELFGQGVGGLSVALGVEGGSTNEASQLADVVAEFSVSASKPNVVNLSAFLREFLGPEIAMGINEFLNQLGLTLWRSGIQILIFLTGLKGIPDMYYEAGRIDGANEWTLFWMVTLPMISPIILAVIIFTIVDSFTDVFNQVLHYIHGLGFGGGSGNFGYASALAWIYFLLIFVIIMIVLLFLRKHIFYRGIK